MRTTLDLNYLSSVYDGVLQEQDDDRHIDDTPVPDGEYIVTIDDIQSKVSKSGYEYIGWSLIIAEGDFQGRIIKKASFLTNPKGIRFLKSDLKGCGVELQSMQQLYEVMEKISGLTVEIKKTHSQDGKWENIYIKRPVAPKEAIIQMPQQIATGTDDVPF